MTLQGLPYAKELAGISFVTTLPPPMTQLSPMVTPGIVGIIQHAPSTFFLFCHHCLYLPNPTLACFSAHLIYKCYHIANSTAFEFFTLHFNLLLLRTSSCPAFFLEVWLLALQLERLALNQLTPITIVIIIARLLAASFATTASTTAL